jgi:hypothetical protein
MKRQKPFTEKFAGWLLLLVIIGLAIYLLVYFWLQLDAMMVDYTDVIRKGWKE